MQFDLRSWLKRLPRPARVRIRTRDDEERMIELGDKRTRWNSLEETVRVAGAVSIECLDAKGAVLRATRLSEDEIEAESDEDARGKHEAKLLANDRRDIAAIIDRYGHRMNESFQAGAAAASVSQDSLVSLVETLTGHLSLAITNLHTVSVNLANIVSEAGGGPSLHDQNGALLTQVLAKAIGSSGMGGNSSSKPGAKAP
jgi:hypothetical protein